ncbi:hypothetical protein [Streptomyces sp. NPDC002402]
MATCDSWSKRGGTGIVLDGGGGGGGGGPTGGSDLERGVQALQNFQTRVNNLLEEFENGGAGHTRVAAQTVSRGSLSGGNPTGFPEAEGLYKQYNRVHQALVSLSRTLGDQIAGLSIGVHASEVGFDNVEEDLRRRYAAIQARIDREHAALQDEAKKPKSEPPNVNDKTSKPGW